MSFIDFDWYKNLLEIFKKTFRPDWNENDSLNTTYIENRTHYSEGTTTTENVTVHLEETTIEVTDQYNDYGLFYFMPEYKKTYIVTFDGIEYECVATIINGNELGFGTEKFVIGFNDYHGETYISTDIGTHTISIISKEIITQEQIHKLDKKYLDMSWDAIDNKPFGEKERENLFTIVYLDDNEGTDSGYVEYQAGIRKLNRYASYDFVIRGDVYKNVKPSCVYNSYYNWITWGGPSVYAGWPLGNYPFCLDTQFNDEYDENGDIMTTTGMPTYGSYFYVNAEVYPYLDIATEVQVYRSSDDGIKHIDAKYMPEGYPSANIETKIIYNQNFTISEDDPFIFEVGIPDLIRGQAYTVILDNIEYECIAVDDGYGGEALGNFYVVGKGEDTGEPFFIFEEYNDDPYACGIAVNTAGDHTVSIKTSVEEIVTIDPKFIQDAYYTTYTDMYTYYNGRTPQENDYTTFWETDVVFVDGMSYDIVLKITSSSESEIDGEHHFKCKAYENDGLIVVGNASIVGYDNVNSENVPFYIQYHPNGFNSYNGPCFTMYMTSEFSSASNISQGDIHYLSMVISGTIETVHKIDHKYLPDIIPTSKTETIFSYDGSGDGLVKVSDKTYTPEELMGATVTEVEDGNGEYSFPFENTEEGQVFEDGSGWSTQYGEIVCYYHDVTVDGVEYTAGMYALRDGDYYVSSIVKETTGKFDAKYLPSTIINVSESSSVDTTPDELINALQNNIAVTVQYDGCMYSLASILYLDNYEVAAGFTFENYSEGYISSIVLYGEKGYELEADIMFEELPSGLPEVTTDDSGKVLTVNAEGIWIVNDLIDETLLNTMLEEVLA